MLLLDHCWGRASPAGHMQHLGTLLLLRSWMGGAFLLQGGGLSQRCYRHHSRRNLLDGSSRLTILQQPVTFHFLKWTVTSSLLTVEDRVPARHGKGWLHTPRSCFKKARFQLSCFSLQGCWHTELRVIFNHRNGGNVPLDWISVLGVVPPVLCREVHGDEGRGGHSWLYKVFLGFLSQITTLCHHRSAMVNFSKVLLAATGERCGS